MNAGRYFLKLVVDRDESPDPHEWLPPLDRRAALKMLGMGALSTVVGCGVSSVANTSNGTSTTATTGTQASTTTLAPSATSATSGASVRLTAAVSPSAATGTVTFYNNGIALGTAALSAGSATLTTSFSGAGTESLTAAYLGDATYAASTSVAVTVTVTGAAVCGSATKAVTEGPYWVSDSASGFFRSSILTNIDGTESQPGVPLALTIYVYDRSSGCVAMQNVQVDIWHCNASGVYSDEAVESTSTKTWLRGYQLTDSTGKVTFNTIVPGWYTGRTTHIHMRFRSTYDSSASGSTNTMQLFFDQTFIDSLDTTASPYTSKGSNTLKNTGDGIFNTEGSTTILSLNGSTAAGYTAAFSIYLPLS